MNEHTFITKPNQILECTVCGQTWKKKPTSSCPGMRVYAWGAWPENLLTKKQMDEAGLQTGAKLPPPAGMVWREKSPNGIMYLYDKNQGVPKKEVTPAQAEALKKAQERARLVTIYCSSCHYTVIDEVTAKRAETLGDQVCDRCSDASEASIRAEEWLKGCVILDTETTGLYEAEIVQLAIINHEGETLLNTLVKPEHPEKMMEKSSKGICAYDIHGIHPDMLANAPTNGVIVNMKSRTR